MSRRLAVLGVFHETNSFSPLATTWSDFHRRYRGDEIDQAFRGTGTVVGGFLAEARRNHAHVAPVFATYATPSGTVTREAFAEILDVLTRELREAPSVDGVLVELHGAMVVEGCADPEAEVLEAVHHRWPHAPVACVLDLHANMSAPRLRSAHCLTGYRTNPHVDTYDRGVQATRQLLDVLEHGRTVYRAHRGLPLIAPPISQRTDSAPLVDILAHCRDLEDRHAMLDVTVHAGYAYADVPYLGMGISVSAEPTKANDAEEVARSIAEAVWHRRDEFIRPLAEPAQAFRTAAQRHGCVAVADTGDNINGGSPGDGTWLLHEALSAEGVWTLASICDPTALDEILSAGVGANMGVRLGGWASPSSGQALDVNGTVLHIGDGVFTNSGPMATGQTVSMGAAAVIRCGQIDLVVQQRPVQPNDPALFRSVELTPESYDVVLLKGAAAVRAGWASTVEAVVDAATPGVTDSDLTRLQFHNAPTDLYRAASAVEGSRPGATDD